MDIELVVKGARVVTSEGVGPRAVHIKAGKVVAVTGLESAPPGVETLDAGELWVIPGIVDSHVHVNEPGRTEWEGFETATRAAAAGGVTTIVDMPLNSIPATTTARALAAKVAALDGKARVDVGLTGGLVPESVGALAEMRREGALAFKCFLAESGVDEFRHVGEADLRRGMLALADLGATLLVHAELPGPLNAAAAELAGDPRRYATYLASRPRTAEDEAVDLVVRLATETDARAHVVHLSSSGALSLLRRAKDAYARITAETCPHYLTFAAEDVPDGSTDYKCAPPIRERENRELLWNALREGLLDQVVTDHSPSDAAMKCSDSGDFMKAWGGISSLQLGLAAVWTEARARGVAFEDVVRWMTERPAKLVGLYGQKGAIAPGFDADLAFVDPDGAFTVDVARLEHRHKLSPYGARALDGVVHRTLLRGQTVYERGAGFVGAPSGRWLRAR